MIVHREAPPRLVGALDRFRLPVVLGAGASVLVADCYGSRLVALAAVALFWALLGYLALWLPRRPKAPRLDPDAAAVYYGWASLNEVRQQHGLGFRRFRAGPPTTELILDSAPWLPRASRSIAEEEA